MRMRHLCVSPLTASHRVPPLLSCHRPDETIMLTDGYGLPLSTTSFAARDAYVEACEAKLTMYPGAIEAFDRYDQS